MVNLTFNDINSFKNYINKNNHNNFALDITGKNIFDSLKFLVLSSSYYYQKFPENKLKCIVKSDDIKTLAANFEINNLEFV